MAYVDKQLTCSDCGSTFVFDAEEQATFANLGYTNEPKRCKACRSERKSRSGGRSDSFAGSRPARQMYPATCSRCKKETEVPFEPRGDRPVYCRDCYAKVSTTSSRPNNRRY